MGTHIGLEIPKQGDLHLHFIVRAEATVSTIPSGLDGP